MTKSKKLGGVDLLAELTTLDELHTKKPKMDVDNLSLPALVEVWQAGVNSHKESILARFDSSVSTRVNGRDMNARTAIDTYFSAYSTANRKALKEAIKDYRNL